MNYINNAINDINDCKDHIAYVIAKAYCKSKNSFELSTYYNLFKKRIDESNIFIIEHKDRNFIKELSTKVKINELLEKKVSDREKIERVDFSDFDEDFIEAYDENYEYYKLIKLSINEYKELYLTSQDKLVKLLELLKELKYFHDKTFSDTLFLGFLPFYGKDIDVPIYLSEYNVKGYDDLFRLSSEVEAYLTGYISDEVISKREDFKRRMKINYDLSKEEAFKIRNTIIKVINDELLRKVFIESNIGDFIKRYGINNNPRNTKKIMNLYLNSLTYTGINFYQSFGNDRENYSIFNSELFYYDKDSQNGIIMHELVHSLDSENKENEGVQFSRIYRVLDEAITEYVAHKAKKYLDENILDIGSEYGVKFSSKYECLIPLVKILKKSYLWNEIVWTKLSNDVGCCKDAYNLDMINKYFVRALTSGNVNRERQCLINFLFARGLISYERIGS